MPETDISLWELCRHFSAWTSVNGLPHVILTHNNWIRLVWAVITFGAFFAGIYQTGSLIAYYFSFPTTIETRIELGILPFPSVTFCNKNAWKATKAGGTPLQSLIMAYNQSGPNRRFGLPWPPSEARRLRAMSWMWLMGERLAQLSRQNGSQLGYQMDEMVADCSYNGRPCSLAHFAAHFNVHLGHCFTFNAIGRLSTSMAGPRSGLRLELRVNGTEYLPWTDSQGIVVFMDRANATPFIDAYGYFARPGFANNFAVQLFRRQKLPWPFNNCTDDQEREVSGQQIHYGPDYEYDACLRSCIQDRIIFLCGCYSPLFNRPRNSSLPQAKLSCLDSANPNAAIDCANAILIGGSQWNAESNCECQFACDQSYYKISTSEAKWPAKNYIPLACTDRDLLARHWAGQLQKCRDWTAQNSLLVHVFPQRLSTISLVEQQTYKVIDFIADAGGALGLWLGMSFVSMLECLMLGVMAVAYCCARPARRARVRTDFDYFAHFVTAQQTQRPKPTTKKPEDKGPREPKAGRGVHFS